MKKEDLRIVYMGTPEFAVEGPALPCRRRIQYSRCYYDAR